MDFGFNALMPDVINKALTTFNSFSPLIYLIGGMALAFLLVTILIKIGQKVKGR